MAADGSTGRLIQLCLGYFFFYVVTGVLVKYFLFAPSGPGMSGMQYLAYSTLGGSAAVFPVVIGMRWYRMASNRAITVMGISMPSELPYIIASGMCTAVVIPTTTLMYTLPISVMVAMTLMRGSVIVIGRVVDAIQIRQGILQKRVYMEENIAVMFALGAVGVHIYFGASKGGGFDFLESSMAVTILVSYIVAYAVRIYLMNFYKNTRGKGVKLDNKGFFALEQFSATGTMVLAAVVAFAAPTMFGTEATQVVQWHDAIADSHDVWYWATVSGTAFGFAAFFSVFIFMYKGRTATFAGLVNRLTSLVAGVVATLLFQVLFGGKPPKLQDWIALGFVLVAVGFLSVAERKRAVSTS